MAAPLLLAFLASSAFASPLYPFFQHGGAPFRNPAPAFHYGPGLQGQAGHAGFSTTPITTNFLTTPPSIAPSSQTQSFNLSMTTFPLTSTSLTPTLTNASSFPPSSLPISTTCSIAASPPARVQVGVVSGCSEWYVAQSNDTCSLVAKKFGITAKKFMAWNPSVIAPNCTRLGVGDAYCVEVCGGMAVTSISTTLTSISPTLASISASVSTLPSSTASSPASSSTPGTSAAYHAYCGSGSTADGWPAMNQWLAFDYLFEQNKPNMEVSCANWGVPNDSAQEIADMKNSINQIATLSGIDARFILAVIMQESTGCVRVITTSYSHANPGLMQSYDGTGSCNSNPAALGLAGTSASNVQTPCPQSEIYQMVLDGTNGTASGPGLRENFAQQNLTGAEGYYRTAKIYNGGINSLLDNENSLESGCCTSSYVSDVANRLLGWTNDATRSFTC